MHNQFWAAKAIQRPEQWRYLPPDPATVSIRDGPSPYYLVPFSIWDPARMFPHEVPYVKCPEPCCELKTTRKSHGAPRRIVGVSSCEWLWSAVFICPVHKSFYATDERSIAKLPAHITSLFANHFVLSERSAVTAECVCASNALCLLCCRRCADVGFTAAGCSSWPWSGCTRLAGRPSATC